MSQTTEPRVENAAEQYERYWVPVVHGPFAADLVERIRPRPGERVLDVACGTGIVARIIARRLDGALIVRSATGVLQARKPS
jgi:ubiquinone/menaquinone biosynthesis C-methylase UbiE